MRMFIVYWKFWPITCSQRGGFQRSHWLLLCSVLNTKSMAISATQQKKKKKEKEFKKLNLQYKNIKFWFSFIWHRDWWILWGNAAYTFKAFPLHCFLSKEMQGNPNKCTVPLLVTHQFEQWSSTLKSDKQRFLSYAKIRIERENRKQQYCVKALQFVSSVKQNHLCLV